MPIIKKILAREILDSRGNPTVEVDLFLASSADNSFGRASVPSGASTGAHEALELRDHDPRRFSGLGVLKAIDNIHKIIAPELINHDWDQASLDKKLIALDGTPTKSRLGANAILGVSLAFARAAANENHQPLYLYLQQLSGAARLKLPVPMFNILNGGRHAPGGTDLQEFMVVPVGAPNYAEALRYGAETYQALKKILREQNRPTLVGDEGGFVLLGGKNEEALELIMRAIQAAGYRPGPDIAIAIDAAASEFYEGGKYNLAGEQIILTSVELINKYEAWLAKYPIISLEDGLAEDDWTGWQELTTRLGNKIKLVGDDLFVTNPARLRQGIEQKVANAILIKPNQIGTLSETLAVIKLAKSATSDTNPAGYGLIISHRSGETEDTFIADLAVGTATAFIKSGAPCHSERTAKYNQLLRIAETI